MEASRDTVKVFGSSNGPEGSVDIAIRDLGELPQHKLAHIAKWAFPALDEFCVNVQHMYLRLIFPTIHVSFCYFRISEWTASFSGT